MRRIIVLLCLGIAALVAAIAVRTLVFPSRQIAVSPAPPLNIDRDAAARRLADALKFKTVSNQDPAQLDPAAFKALHTYLAERFPRVHANLTRETVSDFSLLYRWAGKDPARQPILLLAHLDVVPVEPGTEKDWTHPPFGGVIADGFVWGRGALDDKASLLGTLEAVEFLLAQGFQPDATVYLAFGHDEEVGGDDGAMKIAELLEARGVQAEFALDEGGLILGDGLDLPRPVAVVGTAEKGSVTLALTARTHGGHSSVPPDDTAVSVLAAAITRLVNRQMPRHFRGVTDDLFAYLGPEMPLPQRAAFANLWLFAPLVEWALSANPATNAMLRTTTAPTMLDAGVKENVLPSAARAVVNFRILPGDTVQDVIDHTRHVVADERIEIATLPGAREPTAESPVDAPPFAQLQRTVAEVFPEALFAPHLTVGGTDVRSYSAVTPNLYRFLPIVAGDADRARVHGTDERIGVDAYARAIAFTTRLIQNAAGKRDGAR
ncbi:M20 family peptidase [Candidatus Binatia bacterium]|nr:M20 family peptidase [Candidatus Binatia bacterium]